MGLIVTDLKHDYIAIYIRHLDQTESHQLKMSYESLEALGLAMLDRDGGCSR